jgi:hypothetical protein
MHSDLLNKISEFKLRRYGKIAMELRRGLIDFDEASFLWDSSEHQFRELQDLASYAETGIQCEALLLGMEQLLKS